MDLLLPSLELLKKKKKKPPKIRKGKGVRQGDSRLPLHRPRSHFCGIAVALLGLGGVECREMVDLDVSSG